MQRAENRVRGRAKGEIFGVHSSTKGIFCNAFFITAPLSVSPNRVIIYDPLFCQELAIKKAGSLAITRQPGNLDWKIRGFPSPTYAGFGFILLCVPSFKAKNCLHM